MWGTGGMVWCWRRAVKKGCGEATTGRLTLVCLSVVCVCVRVCVCVGGWVCVYVCVRARVRAYVHACMCVTAGGRAPIRASRRESLMGSRANPLCRLPAFDDEIH